MNRILIVNVNWVGDVLFSTPAIRALREHYPDAYIVCMVVPRCREILELNPRLSEVVVYDEDELHGGLRGKLSLISSLKKRRFDAVFLFHRSLTRTLIAALSGIQERIGVYTKKRSFLLTRKVEARDGNIHKVEQFLDIVRAGGINPAGGNLEFYIGEDDRLYAERLLRSEGIEEGEPFMVLNPGGNWGPKRWPFENYAELGDGLTDIFGARILITGAKKDAELAAAIGAKMRRKPVITCGRTTLRQLAAILRRASLVVSNDSGPMHIAVSQGAKTVAIFGPTDPKATGPYGEGRYAVIQKGPQRPDCRIPCYNLSCKENVCMKAVAVEDVLKETQKLLR